MAQAFWGQGIEIRCSGCIYYSFFVSFLIFHGKNLLLQIGVEIHYCSVFFAAVWGALWEKDQRVMMSHCRLSGQGCPLHLDTSSGLASQARGLVP